MRVLACATEANRGVERLLGSAARHGVAVQLVGAGEIWPNNASKLRALIEPLSSVGSQELVLIVDAWDVLLLAGTAEIERRYEGDRPLFNGEQGFYCPAPWAAEARAAFEDPTVPYPYLNSGAILGRGAQVLALVREAEEVARGNGLISDQAAFYRLALADPSCLAVDRNAEIFCCTGALPFRGLWNRRPRTLRVEAGGVVDTLTGRRPCVLHSPGRKDRYQERVYQQTSERAPAPS